MRKRTAGSIKSEASGSAEPIGIVISSGSRDEDAPKFAAYVWGPVPEAELNDSLIAVA
jgi:hypothetical protein